MSAFSCSNKLQSDTSMAPLLTDYEGYTLTHPFSSTMSAMNLPGRTITTTCGAIEDSLYPTVPPFIDPLFSCEFYSTETRHRQHSISSSDSTLDNPVYAYKPIPAKKRPRRRFDEIERLYHCNYDKCKKSYGTLNHLNSHIIMQGHGPKRPASEFKEMRQEKRQARKQKAIKNKDQQEQLLSIPNWSSMIDFFY